MSLRSSAVTILLLTADQDLQAQLKEDLKEASITVAKDLTSLPRAAAKRAYDGVVIETKRGHKQEVLAAGSRSVLRHAPRMLQTLANGSGRLPHRVEDGFSLEDYIKGKLGDFVKGMKNGSARDLHPILIKAVEAPLITLVLKETNGNQIQAADMLGMNRNTLRKKINEFRISVKRGRRRDA
jgi:DNA-binding protein Fis